MTLYELEREKEGRKAAFRHFKAFLDKDLNYKSLSSNENDLKILFNLYLGKLEDGRYLYFSKEGREELEGKEELEELTKGFLFLNKEITSKKYKSDDLTEKVYNAYEELIKEISEYSFIYHRFNSYGFKQTLANENILMEILFLKPVLIETLKNIDRFMDEFRKSDFKSLDGTRCNIITRLSNLKTKLNNTTKELNEAKEKYHMTWNFVQGRDCSYDRKRYTIERTKSNLGKSKKEWRLKKNEACRVILDFYKEMAKLNVELCFLNPWMFEDLSSLYNTGLNYIAKSPNYYSYLTPEESENLSKENKRREIEMKINRLEMKRR